MSRIGRNDPCSCGSGKKYKQCHGAKTAGMSRTQRIGLGLVAAMVLGGLVLAFATREDRAQPRGVWSQEHGHYH